MDEQDKDDHNAALLPADQSAATKTEALPNTEHSRTCDLVGYRQGYNAPPVCSCGVDERTEPRLIIATVCGGKPALRAK